MELDQFINKLGGRSLFHFTDLQNLPLIRAHGLLALSELRARNIVPPRPGGNQWSHDADRARGLDRFVHLCLVDNHPMEYVARQNKHIGLVRYLRVSPATLHQRGVMGCATVANKRDAVILPLEEALDAMDLDILLGGRVNLLDRAVRDRYNEAKKAEFLVPLHVSAEHILNLG